MKAQRKQIKSSVFYEIPVIFRRFFRYHLRVDDPVYDTIGNVENEGSENAMADLKYCLYYLDKKLFLDPRAVYTIGRNKNNSIPLPGRTISRKHARIAWDEGHFVIVDTMSTNFVFVNGNKCTRHVLFDGDHIIIGAFFLIYREYDAREADTVEVDHELSDTLEMEHQIAELLKSISDKKIRAKLLALKRSMNKAKLKLDRLANRDRLTGLYNRRFFEEELEKEIERARRYQYALSLFMIDIDHFKQINDTFGHQKGDRVLRTIAAIISDNTRRNDLVARYGGEEIVVVIPEIKSNNLMFIAEKIRARIEAEAPKRVGVSVTASIGIAFFTENDSSAALILKADQALYEAKKRGRNRVVIKTNKESAP